MLLLLSVERLFDGWYRHCRTDFSFSKESRYAKQKNTFPSQKGLLNSKPELGRWRNYLSPPTPRDIISLRVTWLGFGLPVWRNLVTHEATRCFSAESIVPKDLFHVLVIFILFPTAAVKCAQRNEYLRVVVDQRLAVEAPGVDFKRFIVENWKTVLKLTEILSAFMIPICWLLWTMPVVKYRQSST